LERGKLFPILLDVEYSDDADEPNDEASYNYQGAEYSVNHASVVTSSTAVFEMTTHKSLQNALFYEDRFKP